jgi:thioredoxin-related protein
MTRITQVTQINTCIFIHKKKKNIYNIGGYWNNNNYYNYYYFFKDLTFRSCGLTIVEGNPLGVGLREE